MAIVVVADSELLTGVLHMSGINWDDVNLDEVFGESEYGSATSVEAELIIPGEDTGIIGGSESDVEDTVPVMVPELVTPVAVVPVQVTPVSNTINVSSFVGNGANVSVKSGGTGKVNLCEASRQWATRPADERFWTVAEMAQKCGDFKAASRELNVNVRRAEVVNDNGEMLMVGGGLTGPARFSHYAFGQLCRTAGAPADYLRELDGELAAKCLTSSLRKAIDERSGGSDFSNVLVRGGLTTGINQRCHAFLSGGYSRIWNADIVGRLGELESRGWRVPPARPAGFDDPRARKATDADVLKNNKGSGGLEVRVGDLIAPAGLYASDKDMFAFMIMEGGLEVGGSVMNRGFFVSNSEVGDRAFSVTTFLYDAVCGNHIVWGASEVTEVRLIHRGKASQRWVGDLQRGLQRYVGNGTERERHAIMAAIGTKIADGKDAVVEKLFKDKRLGLTKKVIESAWDWSVKEARLRGNKFAPESVWGMICGLTRVSQECGWSDQRVAIDIAAGKMLQLSS